MQHPPHSQTNNSSSQTLKYGMQPSQTEGSYRQPTPSPPTYSPVTPEMSNSVLAAEISDPALSSTVNPYPFGPPVSSSFQDSSTHTHTHAHPQAQPRMQSQHPPPLEESPQPPAPQPISLEDNSDAIALRAAMSILQMQRQQALKDMHTLQKQKARAAADPEGFAKALVDGSTKMRSTGAVLLAGSDGEDVKNGEETSRAAGSGPLQNGESAHDGDFGQMEIPGAQNVVRMPPVNWAKYHIVGESLDRLHQEQRVRPTTGGVPEGSRREAEVAAPYDPFVDKLDASSRVESARAAASGVTASSSTTTNGSQAEGVNARRKSGGAKKG